LSSNDLVQKITELAQDKKGQQIVVLNIAKLTNIADYFIIISGDSDVHVKAITDHIEKELKSQEFHTYYKEGYQYLNWVVLDYVDVVVHIFKRESREYYAIERLWADAEIEFVLESES